MSAQDMTKAQLSDRVEALNARIDELLQAKELPHASEPFRFLFDNAPIGLAITNMQGNILHTNKTICEELCYSEEELAKMNSGSLYANKDDRSRLIAELLKTGAVRDFEAPILRKDGTIAIVLLNADSIELESEQVLLISMYDFTRYKQIQEDLSKSAEQYDLLFNNVPIGITVTDSVGNILAYNHAIAELLGYTEEEIKSNAAVSFYVDPQERQRLLDFAGKIGYVRDYETKFMHKSGYEISVLINTDIIQYKGKQEILLNSIREISHIKRIEEALIKERDFSNAILDTTASLVMILNRNGQISRFNRACEVNTGYTAEQIIGKYIWDTLTEDADGAKTRLSELFSGIYPITHESVWRTKDGSRHLISWTSTVLLDNENKEEYVIATGIDITERKRAEIELKEANHKLNRWISDLEERTWEMKQISGMGEHLQSCQTLSEICAIGAQYVRVLYPQSRGAICLFNSSRDLVEAAQIWGDPPYTNDVFVPSDCWGIRRNRPHLVDMEHPGLLCGHMNGPEDIDTLCTPMMANGEFMGILHLNSVSVNDDYHGLAQLQSSERRIQIILEMAEHIAMALSNLKLRDALRQQSIRDSLTGLFNRRYMEETLDRELSRAGREKKPVGIMMFDIDHFKDFNDISGHDAGDTLLRELGAYLVKSTRGADIVCRYGGEEFVAVLPGASLAETGDRAQSLRQGVKDLLVYHLGRPLGKCTISIGVSAYPDDGTTSEEILKRADTALYRAKNEGRDRVVVL